MRPTAVFLQGRSERDDERGSSGSATCPSSTNQNVPLSNRGTVSERAFDKKTPFRPKLADLPIASSASSSGSSRSGFSTSSSLFDRSSTRVGTPLTPPIPETPGSSNVSKARSASNGKAPANFAELLLEKNNDSSATHTPITTPAAAEGSCGSLSAADLLAKCLGNISIRDSDESSSDESCPDQDGSPAQAKNRRRDLQEKNEYFTHRKKKTRRNKSEDASRADGTTDQIEDGVASLAASVQPKVRRNFKLGKDVPRSGRRESSEVSIISISSSEDEGEEVRKEISSMTAQNPPPSGQYQHLEATLSAPRSQKRSKSTPDPNTSDLSTSDSSTARITPRNRSQLLSNQTHASPLHPDPKAKPKPRQRSSIGTATSAPAGGKLRRRSTGSLDPEQIVTPPIELRDSGGNERMPGAFPIGSINLSEPPRQSPTCEPPEAVPDLESDATRKPPRKLERKNLDHKSENDLKNGILHTIRRTGVTRSANGPNLDHGYVYIFKSADWPGYVKIGSTKQAPKERENQWSTKCKFKCVHITDENDKPFRFYGIIERIVHAELYNEQMKFYCDECGSNHRLSLEKKGEEKLSRWTEHSEWFEISETKAKEVVNKWRDWAIHQEPYKQDARLCTRWLWKHDMGAKWMKGSETEWEAWRHFSWLDEFRLGLHDFKKWLEEVVPPLKKLANTSGSFFLLLAGVCLCIWGVNLVSCLIVMTAFLLYRYCDK